MTCLRALALATVISVAIPGAASAKIAHEEVGSFKVEGVPLDVAADSSGGPSDGDVYTAVFPANTVDKFTSTGTLVATITGAESPAGSFGFVQFSTFAFSGITVDSSGGVNNGDLYVADIEHGVVDRLDEIGKFICQITAKKPVSSEEQKHECNGAAGSATNAGSFEPTAATVNPAGDLFVADAAHKAVDEFGSKGEFIEEIAGSDITEPTELAVAPDGALYIVNGGNFAAGGTNVVKDDSGTFTVVDSNEPRGVAVDPTTENLYVQDNNAEGPGHGRIDEYGQTGLQLGSFISNGESQEVGTLAVGMGGDVYDAVSQFESTTIFGPAVVVPTVSIAAASGVDETTATLHGEVSPDTANGGTEVTTCQFEYVTQAQFEATKFASAATVACKPPTPYIAAQSVSATVSGLAPSTAYHYRLAASSSNNHVSRSEAPAEEAFATTGPPTVGAETASTIGRTEATLEAQVNPNGHNTHYEFQYGETESYGTSVPVPAADIGEGEAPVAVSQPITGLKVGTTYHYRVVAENVSGRVLGTDHTLTTVPVAGFESQLVVAGPHTATIKARLDPKMGLPTLNSVTTCIFQYVTEADFVASGFGAPASVPCTPAAIDSSSEEQNVIVKLSGLSADTAYDYRFLIANESGEAAVTGTLATFGLRQPLEVGMFGIEGAPYTQAGGHPYELTTNIAFNSTKYGSGFAPASGRLKDVRVQLPVGLVGDPTATAKCTVLKAAKSQGSRCGPGTQIGVMRITLENRGPNLEGSLAEHTVPLFNVVPAKGVAAEFASGEINAGLNATIDAHVRTGEGYGVSADSLNIPTLGLVRKVSVSVWGVPADPAHNAQRICPLGETGAAGVLEGYEVGCGSGEPLKSFLRAPTSCSGGNLTTNVLADSYNAPGEFVEAHTEMPAITGCIMLRFTPGISVTPESSSSDSPTGLHVDLHIPQEENPHGLAQADLKDATVTLPAGMTVNPASASGLVGCSETQIELDGPEPATCPSASKIGSVEIDTPLIDHPLKGGVYVAQQGNAGPTHGSNEFGSLLALYIAVNDPETGVVVKLAGKVSADPVTGQLTTTFAENPQLPFEDLKLDFFGGQDAALATPQTCGSYTTTTALSPWSGNAAAEPSSPFSITSGPGGLACGAPGFAPSFAAGTTNNQADAFSPFTTTVSRNDDEQDFSTIRLSTPPGLLALLKTVALCPEAQASAGDCPAASQIGHVTAQAGVGSDPITLPEAGRQEDPVFLTGPYGGGPFGLSIVVHPEAGPFDLEEGGRPVIVRAAITVDPHTAQVSIASTSIPTILQGIPVDVRGVQVTIDRAGFMFNPTDCNSAMVGSTIASSAGASIGVSSHFQAANCATLPFKPKFSASTSGKASKAGGASLDVKVSAKGGPQPGGGEANIKSVKVDLPKQLPSRLTTLQKACTAKVFEANPASCPKESNVGMATASTPVLAHPLIGPAYLVSHGGEAFPDLEIVLQGEGITLILDGNTNIKKGITSSTFKAIPDAPISSFELKLPTGKFSILGTNVPQQAKYDLCGQTLAMPTAITGQNGAVVKQTTKIAVSGCPKHSLHRNPPRFLRPKKRSQRKVGRPRHQL